MECVDSFVFGIDITSDEMTIFGRLAVAAGLHIMKFFRPIAGSVPRSEWFQKEMIVYTTEYLHGIAIWYDTNLFPSPSQGKLKSVHSAKKQLIIQQLSRYLVLPKWVVWA